MASQIGKQGTPWSGVESLAVLLYLILCALGQVTTFILLQ